MCCIWMYFDFILNTSFIIVSDWFTINKRLLYLLSSVFWAMLFKSFLKHMLDRTFECDDEMNQVNIVQYCSSKNLSFYFYLCDSFLTFVLTFLM